MKILYQGRGDPPGSDHWPVSHRANGKLNAYVINEQSIMAQLWLHGNIAATASK
jgi:hypothetical protein